MTPYRLFTLSLMLFGMACAIISARLVPLDWTLGVPIGVAYFLWTVFLSKHMQFGVSRRYKKADAPKVSMSSYEMMVVMLTPSLAAVALGICFVVNEIEDGSKSAWTWVANMMTNFMPMALYVLVIDVLVRYTSLPHWIILALAIVLLWGEETALRALSDLHMRTEFGNLPDVMKAYRRMLAINRVRDVPIVLVLAIATYAMATGDAWIAGACGAAIIGIRVAFSELARHIEELNESEAYKQMAFHDALTGCYNLRYLHLDCAEMDQPPHSKAAIVMADIDRFKGVNDTYGHAAGDAVLRHFSDAFRACMETGDSLYRKGGEEFVLILRERETVDACIEVLRAVHAQLRTGVDVEGETIRYTASFGLAWFDGTQPSESVVERADQLLYQSKESGRSRVSYDVPGDGTGVIPFGPNVVA